MQAWRAWRLVACAMWTLGVGQVMAQSTTPPDEAPVATLRVFVDLVQVPVLVLDGRMDPMKDVDASRFTVSVDSGPAVHPRHVRVEGDDPISLGVLLDEKSRPEVMGEVAGGMAALVPAGLHATDHVTLFALRCHLFRTPGELTGQPALLLDGVGRVLKARVQGPVDEVKGPQSCAGEVFLWDALYRVLAQLPTQPGRRVLMVVSDGQDHGSQHTWNQVRELAQALGVAVFGLAHDGSAATNGYGTNFAGLNSQAETPFRLICESSGGVVLRMERADVRKELARMMAMVRQRYVLEFSRPRETVAGRHEMLVKVAKGFAFVRAAGVSVSIPDPAVENDPMTIPREMKDGLKLGKRRILPAPPN